MPSNNYDENTLLKNLCIKVIDLLGELRKNGSISEDEYQKNVFLKKKFLEDIHNQ